MDQRLRLSDIRRMAGYRTYRRGEVLFEQGLVRTLARKGATLHGEIGDEHGRVYRVEIRRYAGDLSPHCNCPNDTDETCEHVVAALLGWRERLLESQAGSGTSVGLEDVERTLRRRRKEDLVEMVLEMGLRDDGLMNRLELEAARHSGKGVDIGRWSQMIRNALSHNFVDYYHTGDYRKNLEALREDLDRLREAGHVREAHGSLAYLLERAFDRYREVTDAEPFFDTLERAIVSYAASLAEAGLGPDEMAREVFDLLEPADPSFLEPLLRATAPALGTRGLEALDRLARARFQAASEAPVGSSVSRRKQRQLRRAVARAQGDDAKYLDILREDLEGSRDYLLAAERLAALGRLGEARELAEQGLAASPRRDPRLLALLSDLDQRLGDTRGALELALEAFEQAPSHELLGRVLALGRGPGSAPVRERLRRRLRKDKGSSLALELLYLEGAFDEILAGAHRGLYADSLLERVAERAVAEHPEVAAELLETLTLRHAARATPEGDRHAARCFRSLVALDAAAGRVERLRRQLRRRHKGRGTLLALLET